MSDHYRGLFHFVRYIENREKYNTDFGKHWVQGEEDEYGPHHEHSQEQGPGIPG